MRKWVIIVSLAALTLGTAAAQERERLRDRGGAEDRRERMTDRRVGEGRGTAKSDATLAYGAADKQRIDLYRPASGGKGQPLILYVHGGGWANGSHKQVSEKPAWASRTGLWFGSIGYRYLPEAPVETQAADVGAAIRKARAEAGKHGYDPNRIILMGHSAGAHLAALVASDPQYAGDAFGAIKAVIPIDGACYDVPSQIKAAPFMAKRTYIPAFGTELARQKALSPLTHAGGRDAPRWLLIYVNSRDDARKQSIALSAALQRGGAQASTKGVEGNHMTVNREFGTAGYPAQAEVDALVKAVVG
jgi:arylformamidase